MDKKGSAIPDSIQMLFKNKIILIGILAVIAILIVVVILLQAPKTAEPVAEAPEMLPPGMTQVDVDTISYEDAVLAGDVDACDSIVNEIQRELCKSTASDVELYTNAVSANDPALCAEISDLNIKDACERLLKFGIKRVVTEV